MNIAIVGYGDQGRSSYDYWSAQGHTITICDQNVEVDVPEGVTKQLGIDYLQNLDGFDLIIRGPMVHPKDLAAANSLAILNKVTTNTNEFFKVCPTKNIIGVTGTKGKGTTSTLISRILEADGKRVWLGGNIGIPPLDMLHNDILPDDWVVLELANFQLLDLQASPHIGVCLMVVPEHMEWHTSEEEYFDAKRQMFVNQTEEDIAIFNADNDVSPTIVAVSKAQKIPYYAEPGALVENDIIVIDGNKICETAELKLLGKHNWENVCAAVTTAWQVTQNIDAIRSVLTSFTGLEHRLEFVRELDGVFYYDDSFGTAPATAIVAMQAFVQPKVIILGGSDKAADYSELAKVVRENTMRAVLLIGDQAERINAALVNAGYTDAVAGGANMTEIVDTAKSVAQPGDIVLLSTACASFDMFKNYKDRGEQFKNAVNDLHSVRTPQ